MNGFNRSLWVHAVTVTSLLTLGCGDRIVLLECPLGTMPEGSQCVPYQAVPDTYAPSEPDGLADFAIAEDLSEPADLPETVDTQKAELPNAEDTIQVTGGVGSTCKGTDCGEVGHVSIGRVAIVASSIAPKRLALPARFVRRYPGVTWLVCVSARKTATARM